MANKKTNQKGKRIMYKLLIAAAMISLLAVYACASEYIPGWFARYFSGRGGKPLALQQIQYIEDVERRLDESHTENQWTVELRSAMYDDSVGYIILGITAPEGVNLEPEWDENGIRRSTFSSGNGSMAGRLAGAPDVISAPKGVLWKSLTYSWEEDGDGLKHTKNIVIQMYPDMERCSIDPFGSDAIYHVYIENIVREYEDEVYRKELLNGKYAGQKDVMFTDAETRRLNVTETLVEGIWEFCLVFSSENGATAASEEIELLRDSVTTMAQVIRKTGPKITDYAYGYEEVTVTSVVMRPLSVTITYADCGGSPQFALGYEGQAGHIYAVMKDGSRIELLPYGPSGTNYVTFEAETPIVLSLVDHILLGDGSRIPVSKE